MLGWTYFAAYEMRIVARVCLPTLTRDGPIFLLLRLPSKLHGSKEVCKLSWCTVILIRFVHFWM